MATESGVRDGLSSVTRGTLFLLIGTLCFVGLNFVSRVVIIRSVSYTEWNAFSFGLALVGVVSAVGTLGLPSAVARSLPYVGSDAERRTIIRGALTIGSAAALISGIALWLLGPSIGHALQSPDLARALYVFPIAVGAGVAVSIIAAIFQGYEDVTPNALYVQIVTPALFVGFLLAVLLLPPTGIDYESALLAYVAANVLSLLLVIGYALRRLPRLLAPGPGSPGALGHLLRLAAPLFLVSLLGTLTGSGDTLVLGVFHPTEVGTYAASLTLARLLQVGVGAASYIFLPVAARFLRQKDTASIQVMYVTVTKWMILFSLPLFLLFFLVPSRALDFVYGPNYAVIVLPLQLTVLGAFLTTVFGPAANAQVAFGQSRLLAYNSLVAAVVDIGVAFVLVPAHGTTGAAIAWGVANVVYTALSLLELGILTGVQPFRPHFVLPLVVCALPVGAVLAFAPVAYPLWSLPVIGLGIAGVFLLAVLITHSIDEGDRHLLAAVEGLVGRPLPIVRRLGRYGLPRGRG